jgi:hypothetical protein
MCISSQDWRGGVTRRDPDGRRKAFPATEAGIDIRPNGIALYRDRTAGNGKDIEMKPR